MEMWMIAGFSSEHQTCDGQSIMINEDTKGKAERPNEGTG
jgi:hypothetical protein